MKLIIKFFLFTTFSLTLRSMENNTVTVEDLKPFLDGAITEPEKSVIEKIKNSDTDAKIKLWIESVSYLAQHNSVEKASSIIDFLFDERSINTKSDYGNPIKILLWDSKTANKALYKYNAQLNNNNGSELRCNTVLSDPQACIRLVNRTHDKNSIHCIYLEKKTFAVNNSTTKTQLRLLHDEILSNKDFFLKINSLNEKDLEKEKLKKYKDEKNIIMKVKHQILYWKEVLKPTFYPETVTKEDLTFYYETIFTTLCCFKILKKKKMHCDNVIIKNCIIPRLCASLFIDRSNKVFFEVQDIFKKMKISDTTEAQISFILNNSESWFKEEMNNLISFDNVKKLCKYHNCNVNNIQKN